MWPSFLWLTVFQILTAIQLTLAAGEKASPVIPICFLILTAVMWALRRRAAAGPLRGL